ncbi:lef6 [Choristoneura murinana nucleopolyhedrovirus]|uniref:Lef6 n=1 Tax=Choristoneura murinana nucleopolyhedrovirus TaxID=1987479 RepID=V9XPZ4_9ABAC|nr:lef6 [Choristoneura murinana nucleopolyhedrovirus]AHD25597.1 lef6 [Choristoneura murinana nucleopolyhedrovirus]BBU37594.1 late expression factor 6 [Choristoneura diversana nucleopolyhedrovirus]
MQGLPRTPARCRASALPSLLRVHAMLFWPRQQMPDVSAGRGRFYENICGVMELHYNGQMYRKRFSRELIALMCADAAIPCDAEKGINWRQSSRRCLRVRDERVFNRLQRCSERYFWPDGSRFRCRPRKRRLSPRQETWSPPCASPPRTNDTALEDYARVHGYDQEEGELTPCEV